MRPKRKLRILFILISMVLLSALMVPGALAYEGRGGDSVFIPSGEVIADDLYVITGAFTLEGTVQGDVIVLARSIIIGDTGVVEGDLIAAGEIVSIYGGVRDDARIAGYALMLGERAQVGDELIGAAFSFETKAGSRVGGALLYAGSQALLAGDVDENVAVGVGGFELRGRVGGDVKAEVGSPEDMADIQRMQFIPDAPPVPAVQGGLTLSPQAEIGGDLEYHSAIDALIPAGVVSGTVTRYEPTVEEAEEAVVTPTKPTALVKFYGYLRDLVTLLIAGLLMAWLVPNFIKQGAGVLQKKPLPSLGWGIVSIFAWIVALIVLMVAVVLLAIILGAVTLNDLMGTTIWTGLLAGGVLTYAFCIVLAYVSKIMVSYLGGRLILSRVYPAGAESRVLPTLVGVVIYILLTAIPYLGGLVTLVVVLLGMGAVWMVSQQKLTPQPALSTTPE